MNRRALALLIPALLVARWADAQEITPGASAVTASANDGNVPGNAVDNALGTRWSANGDGQWLQIDLGSARTVTHVTAAFYLGNQRQSRFDLQVATTSGAWNTVWSGSSGGTGTGEETFDFPDASARWVRYLGHGNTQSAWNSVAEISVFGSGTPAPTATPTPRVSPTPTPTARPTSSPANTVTVTLNPAQARTAPIPSDFAGLSIEMEAVRFDFKTPNGAWLSSANAPYIAMLKRIGVRNLRIGGNTTERTTNAYPTDADATRANDFMNAIGGTHLLWCLPVDDRYNTTSYTAYAQRMAADRSQKGFGFTTTFSIGNEPDGWGVSQPTWQTRFDAYSAALESALGSAARYSGPGTASSPTYVTKLVSSSRYQGALKSHVSYVTHHWYPFGGAGSYSSASAAIAAMLSSSNAAKYQSFYNGWARAAQEAGFKPRLEETNSMYLGGYSGASDSFAASLWALDYLSYFAHNTELAGVNFHTANKASAYNPIEPVGLASSYTLKGVGYGLLAFEQGGQGRPVPRTVGNPSNVNLTAYATLQSNGTETVRIINKGQGASAADATVVIDPGKAFAHADVMYLKATNNNPGATTGITLGGQAMSTNGAWSGTFTLTLTPVDGKFSVALPRTQAAIVHLY